MLLFCPCMLVWGTSGWAERVITIEGLLFVFPKLALLLLLHWGLLLYDSFCPYGGFVVVLETLDTTLHCCKLCSYTTY